MRKKNELEVVVSLITLFITAALFSAQPPVSTKFEIQNGDRIVWIGDTLVEREQRYGFWETALHAAFPDKQFTLRNLGWSGDTVFGEARAGFDNTAKGFERLVSLTLELKPTIIFVSYGANESFAGEMGLKKFELGMIKLLDALQPAKARIVLFSPLPVLASEMPAGDAQLRNRNLLLYAEAVRTTAALREILFVDLYRMISKRYERLASGRDGGSEKALTVNGVHLNEHGYQETASDFCAGLGQPVSSASGLLLNDELRKLTVAKNEMFFYRWRPQNETYLFGFRKHEQGKNAAEVAEFDPLVAKMEEKIEELRKKFK